MFRLVYIYVSYYDVLSALNYRNNICTLSISTYSWMLLQAVVVRVEVGGDMKEESMSYLK